MSFNIHLGVPEIEDLWNDLAAWKRTGSLGKDEEKYFKKLIRAFTLLAENPRHNSLATHEIDALTQKHGTKVFQSYLENNTPGAGRFFWVYGPDKGSITVLAIVPHPESQKRGAYDRIKLSSVPPPNKPNQGDK